MIKAKSKLKSFKDGYLPKIREDKSFKDPYDKDSTVSERRALLNYVDALVTDYFSLERAKTLIIELSRQ